MRWKIGLQVAAGAVVVMLVAMVSTFAVESEPVAVEPMQAGVKGPRLQFEELEHDFGKAISGEALKTIFKFKNIGKELLVIERVSGG